MLAGCPRAETIDATYAVAAAVHVKVGSSCDTSNEGEESAENVESQREDRVNGHGLLHGDEGEVEKREHAEYSHEHVVVDDRGPARDGKHVSDECHTDEDEEELRSDCISCCCCDSRRVSMRDMICRIPEVLGGRHP